MLTANVPPGVKADELAALCGVSIRTARRWIANGYMPSGLAIGFKLLKDGDLGNLHKAWRGWRLVGDKIYSPDGWDFRPGEIAAIPLRDQLIKALRAELQQPGPCLLPLD